MKWRAKLRCQRGVTLTELMVTLVVMALLSLAVTTGISAGLHTYQQSTTLSRTQSLQSTLYKAVSDELRYAREIQADSTYVSPAYGEGARLSVDDAGHVAVGSRAMAAKAPLVGNGAYGQFTADIQVDYDKSEGCFTVSLSVFEPGTTEAVTTQEFAVRALNAK